LNENLFRLLFLPLDDYEASNLSDDLELKIFLDKGLTPYASFRYFSMEGNFCDNFISYYVAYRAISLIAISNPKRITLLISKN